MQGEVTPTTAPRRWIRLDVSWEDSAWLDELTGTAAGCWPRLLCLVKRDGIQGRCKRPNLRTIARRWRVPMKAVTTLEEAAVRDGALRIEDGDWVVVNWAKYQTVDQTAAERKRRQRKRQRAAVTDVPRDVTAVTRDPPVTRRVTETETETETKTIEPTVSEDAARAPEAEPEGIGAIRFDNVSLSILNGFQPDAGHVKEATDRGRDLAFEFREFVAFRVRKGPPKNWGAALTAWLRRETPTIATPEPGSEYEAALRRGELPRDNGVRSTSVPTPIGGTNQQEATDVARRIADWEEANPGDAEQLRTRVAAELTTDPVWSGVRPGRMLEEAAKIKYRSAVIERLEASET